MFIGLLDGDVQQVTVISVVCRDQNTWNTIQDQKLNILLVIMKIKQ
jgi:hypothetical protein